MPQDHYGCRGHPGAGAPVGQREVRFVPPRRYVGAAKMLLPTDATRKAVPSDGPLRGSATGCSYSFHRDSSKVSPKPPGLASPVLALGTLGLLALGARDVCLAPWSELALASAFAATLAPLPADPELDLLSSSLDLVRVEGLPALPASSSLDLVRVEGLPALPSSSSLDLVRVEAPCLPSSSLHMRLVGLWPGLT